MTDAREPTADTTDAAAEMNELAGSLLDASIELVRPLLAAMCERMIIASVRGQIGIGAVELEPYGELGIRISGERPDEYIGQNDGGQTCVFYEGCDLLLTARGTTGS